MPFSIGGNEVARNRAAENLVGELEFPAARQRLHANPAIAELPVAAGLLLVPALHVGASREWFRDTESWARCSSTSTP